MLAPYIKKGGTVLCSCFGTPFWSVDERERGFKTWWPKFRPDGLLLVHAGGTAGMFSAIIGGWINGETGSQPVTREVGS